MPTLWFLSTTYIFSFYSSEAWGNRLEKPHVHVSTADARAKFWIDSAECVYNSGFSGKELRQIQGIINQHRTKILETWNGHFNQ
jgi:Domain of unknown function (DUF4160)